MHIAIITAGGAGMFCGSCMHDNTWARALIAEGTEVSLIPTYTPIRLDEDSVSESHVYYGGLNVYLNSKVPLWNRLPRVLTRWLDRPGLIRWATKFSVENDASKLGKLTLQMLEGEHGPHQKAGEELAQHITRDLKPDVVIFSNALLVGALHELKQQFTGPVFCTLQGDDVFLDGLPDSLRKEAIANLSERAQGFDGYLVHSRFYRDYMAGYLSLPVEKFHILPLGIDLSGHSGIPGGRDGEPFTVGYFARIAPEKGLHHLTESFRRLHERHPEVQLKVGGYLGPQHQKYFDDAVASLGPAQKRFLHIGSPETHEEKVAFLRSIDVLSVPTEFLEPKGLYVLEALANGVPVVQPEHGAFPELIQQTGGGLLFPPRDPVAHSDALASLIQDRDKRMQLGAQGQQAVRERYGPPALAKATLDILSDAPRTEDNHD